MQRTGQPIWQTARHALYATTLGMALLGLHSPVAAYDAEIVSLIGLGQSRASTRDDWHGAAVRDRLDRGSYVRTGDFSQMALLLGDQTQLRLNRNSMVQLREVGAQGTPTTLELSVGRVWAQAKRRAPMATDPTPAVTIHTPNAVAAIRGTDWDLAVEPDGSATLTVLSGVVEFSNPLGSVQVGANEQASVVPGQAPVKRLLTNARERVQWVTAYRPEPRRWAGADAPRVHAEIDALEAGRTGAALALLAARRDAPAAVLHADLLLSLGRVDEAIALLTPYANQPRHAALLARALLIADRADEAARTLAQATAQHPDAIELQLAAGDLARFNGDAPTARAAFGEAVDQGPDNAHAWFGLGRVDAEREDIRPARSALQRSIELDPRESLFPAELATLETMANELHGATARFQATLEAQPDDYVALTGLGILQLKKGEPDAALESFLKAGVIEPRYARAALWQGVAYYQLGRTERAEEMLRRAAELDPRDPLPHMMLSLIASDRLDYGGAVDDAQRAAELMPYLKSLNQLLNNQKGNANTGAALAQFGLEEWAHALAYDAYTPYWAGSHLFLADRYSGNFLKNSELFKGFLADPSVFGASNRQSSLVATPGHHATLGMAYLDVGFRRFDKSAVLNGYSASVMPTSYFLRADDVRTRPDDLLLSAEARTYTLGLGIKPSHAFNAFVFANRSSINSLEPFEFGTTTVDNLNLDSRRHDVGINVRLGPESQAWLKTGNGKNTVEADRVAFSPLLADNLFELTGVEFSPFFPISPYIEEVSQKDIQFRYTSDLSPAVQATFGHEHGVQEQFFLANIFLLAFGEVALLPYAYGTELKSDETYFAARIQPNDEWLIDAALSHARVREAFLAASLIATVDSVSPTETLAEQRSVSEWNPRLGFAWSPNDAHTLRFATQRWRRPASVNSLAPMDTAGIPLDDRIVAVGGLLKRVRAQYEWKPDASTFVLGYVDHREANSLPTPSNPKLVSDVDLSSLDALRNRQRLTTQAIDFWETTPSFGEGRIQTLGLAINRVLHRNLSGAARLQLNHGRNTTSTYRDNRIPYLPNTLLNLQLTWLAAPRWQLRAGTTYRSRRYIDEANTVELRNGWGFGIGSYWESADKRWSAEAVIENLYADKRASAGHAPVAGLQIMLRL
ncbi:MAG: TonB-dependent receptor [Rhodocyclales bacterium]|nr:TonB-dependent receptor [Rhodocyclales bacterium]